MKKMKSYTEVCILLARLRGEISAREYQRRIGRLHGVGFTWFSGKIVYVSLDELEIIK